MIACSFWFGGFFSRPMVSSSPDQTAFVPIEQQVDSSVRRLRYRANPTLRTDEQSLFSDDSVADQFQSCQVLPGQCTDQEVASSR